MFCMKKQTVLLQEFLKNVKSSYLTAASKQYGKKPWKKWKIYATNQLWYQLFTDRNSLQGFIISPILCFKKINNLFLNSRELFEPKINYSIG